jgi:hypothetical protein
MYKLQDGDTLVMGSGVPYIVCSGGTRAQERGIGPEYRWPCEMYYGSGNWLGHIARVIPKNIIQLGGE